MVQAVQTLLTVTKPVEQERVGTLQAFAPTKQLTSEFPTTTYPVLGVKGTEVDEQVAELVGH